MMILIGYCTLVGLTFVAMLFTIIQNYSKEVQMTVLAVCYMLLMSFTLCLVNSIVDDRIANIYYDERCDSGLQDIILDEGGTISSDKLDLPTKV